jgi:hypothetical protein
MHPLEERIDTAAGVVIKATHPKFVVYNYYEPTAIFNTGAPIVQLDGKWYARLGSGLTEAQAPRAYKNIYQVYPEATRGQEMPGGFVMLQTICEVTPQMEVASRWDIPSINSQTRYWRETLKVNNQHKPTGIVGSVRSVTESQALDRLREAFPKVGMVQWISKQEYELEISK